MAFAIRARNRILHILRLFERQTVWTVEAIGREMGTSTSSAYRDVQELCQAGFLAPVVGSGYVLGPAFIQYDRLVRMSDPLIRHAMPTMHALLERTTQRAVAVLSRRYRDEVMCVHQEVGSAPHPLTVYERGVAMPLFSGATSKAILAHLSERTLERIYLEHEDALRRGGCTGWKAFREQLEAIRTAGYAVTVSEVASGRVGVAAPIHASGQVIGGLSLVMHEPDYDSMRFPAEVVAAAQAICVAVSADQPWIARN
jgi:DNA-binding IclR family transcriptional regulator